MLMSRLVGLSRSTVKEYILANFYCILLGIIKNDKDAAVVTFISKEAIGEQTATYFFTVVVW